jgi:hypothetical protein
MSTAAGTATLDPRAQRVIEEQRARRLDRLAARERRSLVISVGGFLATAVAMGAAMPSDRTPSAATILVLIGVYALAFRLDFEIGTGSAVPTQLVLVPMLFVLPTGLVPIAVASGVILGSLTEYARGGLHLERVFMRLGNCWHAVGPALVLGFAGEPAPDLGDWPLYLAALGAQFALDYGSSALRGWTALGVPPRVQLRTMGLVYLIDFGLAAVGLAVAFATLDSPYGVLLVVPLVGLLSVFAKERRVRIDHELELRDAYRGTAFLLGDVVEADDGYTGEHSRDVVALTLGVVDELGLDESFRRDAEFVALLHDVGKLGKVGRIVRSCHERYDGTGYPDGLAGEDIPPIARIVYCCDAYNAMTSDRSYRAAMPRDEAVAELRRGAGTQFDPEVVDALVAVVERA